MRTAGTMPRMIVALLLSVGTLMTDGCGEGGPTSPNLPTVINGEVVDARSVGGIGGIPNASVSVIRGSTKFVTSTSPAGLFRLEVPPGPATLEVSAFGFVKFSEPIT